MRLCILCEAEPAIKNSHVTPAFAYRRMKQVSAVKTFRHSNNPKLPVQDGLKKPYLGKQCEMVVSGWETYFCKAILDRYEGILYSDDSGSVQPIVYDSRLSLFLSSVHFRYLRHLMDENGVDASLDPRPLCEKLKAACLARDPAAGGVYHYLYFLHPIRSIRSGLPPGINTYYFFATDGQCFALEIPRDSGLVVSYVKLPGFGLIACDRPLPVRPEQQSLRQASVIEASGSLDPAVPENILLALLQKDIVNRSIDIQEQQSVLPAKQMRKIEQEVATARDVEVTRRHIIYQLDCRLLDELQQLSRARAGAPSRP